MTDVIFPACRDTEPVPFPRKMKIGFPPDPAVIDMLETLLGYARTGELQAVAVAVVYTDGLLPGAVINSGWAAAPGCYFAINSAIGKLSRARDRYCDDITMKDDYMPGAPGPA